MNLNRSAAGIAREMVERQDSLGITSFEMENGTTVIDCGVESKGSLEAGVMFSRVCMGGLARIRTGREEYGGLVLDTVEVETHQPAVACLASQKAGWNITGEGFFSLGSGPARVLARKPKETFQRIGYTEESDEAVICLEASRYPPEAVCEDIARACGISPEGLYVLIARTACQVSSVQISARMVETAIFRLDHLGVDTREIKMGRGVAPIAPVVGDDNQMMGITNDMVIYGSSVYLETEVDLPVESLPSVNSEAYGKPFADIFRDAGYDFYKVNPAIFAPAEVEVLNLRTGRREKAGRVNPQVLKESLGV
ncbi:MAG: methenyltetrahydromethanopterin cyclohydrolase [Euryarchaeota archaeon]|nr:methenyltetrahydromethanopterin cyclohydrolase [Euryarchaeota archaeon]